MTYVTNFHCWRFIKEPRRLTTWVAPCALVFILLAVWTTWYVPSEPVSAHALYCTCLMLKHHDCFFVITTSLWRCMCMISILIAKEKNALILRPVFFSSIIRGSLFSPSHYSTCTVQYLPSLLPKPCYLVFNSSQHWCWNNCYQYARDICCYIFSSLCVYTCVPATEQELIINPARIIALQSIWVLSWRHDSPLPDVCIPSQSNKPLQSPV